MPNNSLPTRIKDFLRILASRAHSPRSVSLRSARECTVERASREKCDSVHTHTDPVAQHDRLQEVKLARVTEQNQCSCRQKMFSRSCARKARDHDAQRSPNTRHSAGKNQTLTEEQRQGRVGHRSIPVRRHSESRNEFAKWSGLPAPTTLNGGSVVAS